MILLKVEVEQLRDLGGKFTKFSNVRIVEIRRDELRSLGKRIVKIVQDEAPADLRKLRKSVGYRTEGGKNTLTLTVYVGTKYASYVMGGTRPHWAPIAPLKGWAARHGINVYALQHTIAVKGTRPNQFQVRAFARSQGDINTTSGRIALRVANELNAFVPVREYD